MSPIIKLTTIQDQARREAEDLLEISTDEFLRLRRSSAWLTLIRATVDLMREKDKTRRSVRRAKSWLRIVIRI